MNVEVPWSHEQAVVNDVRLHYVEAGDDAPASPPADSAKADSAEADPAEADSAEAGPLVVLLHGFPEFWYSWRRQILTLADAGFRVVAPDMRGYNRSEKPRGVERYRMEELVGDVVALVEHFDAESAHVVGHDWGGVVAWATAIRHPDAVEKLTVLNAPHPGRFRRALRRNPRQWRRSWYTLAFQVPRLPELALGACDCTGIGEMLRETANEGTFDEADLRRYREAACRPGALRSAIDYYRAAFRSGVRAERRALFGGERPNRRVRMPTLLVWGERDPALGVELTEGLDEWVSDLRVERLPEASHWVQNDAPERVNELLVDFLGE